MDGVKEPTQVFPESVSDSRYEHGEGQILMEKGGTLYDVHDMSRMGKKQQLKVRCANECSFSILYTILITVPAKLPFLLNCRFYYDPPVNMGERITVSKADKRGKRRSSPVLT